MCEKEMHNSVLDIPNSNTDKEGVSSGVYYVADSRPTETQMSDEVHVQADFQMENVKSEPLYMNVNRPRGHSAQNIAQQR